MAVTTAKEQATWVGVQGFCWNAGRIVASGFLVTLTGYLFDRKLGGATRYKAVVAGTTAGMVLANAPVVFLGKAFSDRLPFKAIHYVASGLFLGLGVVFLVRAVHRAF